MVVIHRARPLDRKIHRDAKGNVTRLVRARERDAQREKRGNRIAMVNGHPRPHAETKVTRTDRAHVPWSQSTNGCM